MLIVLPPLHDALCVEGVTTWERDPFGPSKSTQADHALVRKLADATRFVRGLWD